MGENTQRYLEFINFCLGASGVVRQNLQNSNTAESSVRGETRTAATRTQALRRSTFYK